MESGGLQARRLYRYRWFAAGGVMLIVVGAVVAFVALRADSSPFPTAVRREVAFPLYYPKSSAQGFKPDFSHLTYEAAAGVLILPLRSTNGHQVTLSEQAKPPELSIEQLTGQGEPINTPSGHGGMSNVEGRNVAFLVSSDNKTLVLLNSIDATDDELRNLVRALSTAR